jgi:hypothetical protein
LLAEHPVLRLQVFDDVLLGAIDPSRDDQDQKLKLESAHPRERTPGSESDAGTKAATAPAFRTLESFTFRIDRLLAHYGVYTQIKSPRQNNPKTVMPQFGFTHAQVTAIIEALRSEQQ